MSQLRRCSIALRRCACNRAVLPLISRIGVSRSYGSQSPAAGKSKQDELLDVWTKCWLSQYREHHYILISVTSSRLQLINTDRPQHNNRVPGQASQCWKAPIVCRSHHNIRGGNSDLLPCRWRIRVTRTISTSTCLCTGHCSRTTGTPSAISQRRARRLFDEANIIPPEYPITKQCAQRPHRYFGRPIPPNETALADTISPGTTS